MRPCDKSFAHPPLTRGGWGGTGTTLVRIVTVAIHTNAFWNFIGVARVLRSRPVGDDDYFRLAPALAGVWLVVDSAHAGTKATALGERSGSFLNQSSMPTP